MAIPPQVLVVGCAYVMGFVAAIPIGATQLEIARRSLRGYLSAALMVMIGSVSSDVLYGIIAFFGFAPFLQDHKIVAVFLFIGATISIVLGVWIILTNRRQSKINLQYERTLREHRLSYVTGFSLAFANPLMIAWWLLGAQMLAEADILRQSNRADIICFLSAGALGIVSYHFVLAIGVYKAKTFLSEQTIRRITVAFGVILLGLAGYLLVRAINQL